MMRQLIQNDAIAGRLAGMCAEQQDGAMMSACWVGLQVVCTNESKMSLGFGFVTMHDEVSIAAFNFLHLLDSLISGGFGHSPMGSHDRVGLHAFRPTLCFVHVSGTHLPYMLYFHMLYFLMKRTEVARVVWVDVLKLMDVVRNVWCAALLGAGRSHGSSER